MLNFLRLTGLLGFLVNINTASVLAQPALPIVEQAGIILQFQGCSSNSTNNSINTQLKCEFLVENTKGSQTKFKIYAYNSRIVDSEGNEIEGVTANLGNSENKTIASSELIKGVPIKGSITFEEFPKGEIRLLDLRCHDSDEKFFNIQFSWSQQ